MDLRAHADASRPGPVVQVGHDLDDGCRGPNPLLTYGEGSRAWAGGWRALSADRQPAVL